MFELDHAALETLLGIDIKAAVVQLYEEVLQNPTKKPKDFRSLKSNVIGNKEARTQVHQTVRRVFCSKLETTTSDDDTIAITVAPPAAKGRGGGNAGRATQLRGKLGWQELGGEHLHFSLYKENKDTMEAVYFLASQLKVQTKAIQFGGTKDRRAVSVQRCSAYRINAEQVAGLNRRLRGAKVGDFEYQTQGLELGDLGGNEFVITLRGCHFPGEEGLSLEKRLVLARQVLSQGVQSFNVGGFINYYGLQRFGSFATSTDEIGTKLLHGDLAGAISDILSFSPTALAAAQPSSSSSSSNISQDDKDRAEALNIWLTEHDTAQALAKLPKRFNAENSIITHLGRKSKDDSDTSSLNDYQGALGSIPRNLRLMYVHAYQSLVWNTIAGKRWELFGDRVIEGDLILVHEHNKKAEGSAAESTIDEQGEPIILAAPTDRATQPDDFERARPLTSDEAVSGRYNIFDVVLPLPGFDVVYPSNAIGQEYKTFMGSERGGGLDPYDMRRSWKDLSLSGGYRKMLARPKGYIGFEIKTYEKVEEQLVQTDLEQLLEAQRGEQNSTEAQGGNAEEAEVKTAEDNEAGDDVAKKNIAVILRMQLGSSTYATMALRELMKQGGVKTYKAEFGGRR